jgi:hypothetical protein
LQGAATAQLDFNMRAVMTNMLPTGRKKLFKEEFWIKTFGKGPLTLTALREFQRDMSEFLVLQRALHAKETRNMLDEAFHKRLRLREIVPAGFLFLIDDTPLLCTVSASHRMAGLLYQAPDAVVEYLDLFAFGFSPVHAVVVSGLLQSVSDQEKAQPQTAQDRLHAFLQPHLQNIFTTGLTCSLNSTLAVGPRIMSILDKITFGKGSICPLTGDEAKSASYKARLLKVAALYCLSLIVAKHGTLVKFIFPN